MKQHYFGSTASAAIAQARLDAGDEAVLLEVRAEINGAGYTAVVETSPGIQPELPPGLQVEREAPPPAPPAALRSVPRLRRRVMAFAGPCGAGKTASLVKVAVAWGLRNGRAVGLVTLDDQRFGAIPQFRAFAEILGAPLLLPKSDAQLAACREILHAADLILIDTPGLGSNRTGEMETLASRLAGIEELETHLVVNATAGRAQLERTIDQWSTLRPGYLLPTHVEELAAGDDILASIDSFSLPVRFRGTGPSIPDDLDTPAAWVKREPNRAGLLAKRATAA